MARRVVIFGSAWPFLREIGLAGKQTQAAPTAEACAIALKGNALRCNRPQREKTAQRRRPPGADVRKAATEAKIVKYFDNRRRVSADLKGLAGVQRSLFAAQWPETEKIG